MVRKRGLVIAIMLIVVLGLSNVFMFLNKGEVSYASLSGLLIKDTPNLPFDITISFIIFALQWVVLILIVIIVYSRFLKHKKDFLTQQDYHIIKQKKTKSETDLDILYDLLQNKKRLNIGTISKVFGISKDKALEWAKILENHELITIDYPTFRIPEVRLNEKETKQEEKAKQGTKEKGKEAKGGKETEKGKPTKQEEKAKQGTKEKGKSKSNLKKRK